MKKEIENIMEMFDDIATIGKDPRAGKEKGFMGANIDDRNRQYYTVLKTIFGYDAFCSSNVCLSSSNSLLLACTKV